MATGNVEEAYNYFVGQGFTPPQSAGIVGNLIQESGVNPEAVEPNGVGHGIAQWSAGGRWNPALMTGNQSVDLQNQLNYIMQEFNTSYRGALDSLLASSNVDQAALAFGKNYEQYGVQGARVSDAEQVLQMAQTNNWNLTPGTPATAVLASARSNPTATFQPSGGVGTALQYLDGFLNPRVSAVPGIINMFTDINGIAGTIIGLLDRALMVVLGAGLVGMGIYTFTRRSGSVTTTFVRYGELQDSRAKTANASRRLDQRDEEIAARRNTVSASQVNEPATVKARASSSASDNFAGLLSDAPELLA